MNNGVYRFQFGKFNCAIVSDGTTAFILEAAKLLFASAAEDEQFSRETFLIFTTDHPLARNVSDKPETSP